MDAGKTGQVRHRLFSQALGLAMSRSLIKPCADFKASYDGYIRELGDEERYPFPLDFDHSDFPALLQGLGPPCSQ